MRVDPPVAEILEIATSTGSLPRRAHLLLHSLQGWIPFDAGWLAVCDPRASVYTTVGSTGLSRAALDRLDHLGRAEAEPPNAPNSNAPNGNAPTSPEPFEDTPELEPLGRRLSPWTECLSPGQRGGRAIAIGLFEPDGLHVGLLGLRFPNREAPPTPLSQGLAEVTPLIARALSPMRSLLGTTRLVQGATAGAALFRDGDTQPLPGLHDDPLLVAGSPVIEIARATLLAGVVFRSFVWPVGEGVEAQHVRVTVLAATGLPSFVLGTVTVTPDADLQGLTPRELEVLGLLVDGRSNQQIARTLAVTPRTVAAHVEHLLGKLDVPTRTLAAVHAEREGCYVPRRDPQHPRR